MALLPNGGFNANEVEPQGSISPVPPGEYTVMIIDSEMKQTSAGTGSYLKLTFRIIEDEEYEGRFIWKNLNLDNPSEQAVEIAQRELSAICHAVDVLEPEDSQELHGIPMLAKVKVVPPKNGYDASNDIGSFKLIE